MTRLQVLISAYGQEGIQRVAAGRHPQAEGVEYIVSWQLPEGEAEIPAPLIRDDFRIVRSRTRGLSRNRNLSLLCATAPLALIADDDISYTRESLLGLTEYFDANPGADILLCASADGEGHLSKPHVASVTPLRNQPKGYYVSSVEIAFRTEPVRRHKLWFNECFGIGAPLPMGEESVWLTDAVRAGLKAYLIPLTICTHPGATTSERLGLNPGHLGARSAAISHQHPLTWPLRMITHTLREGGSCKGGHIAYMRHWLRGIRRARRLKAFPTQAPIDL